MKTIRLIAVVLLSLFAMDNLAAQTYRYHSHHRPTVYLMAVEESDSLYSYPVSGVISMNRVIADNTRDDFSETMRTGFQQVQNPQFVFATRNNRFALGIGGYINLRTSYDFMGAVDNIDFVPYNIPMSATYANRQRIMMDATTSRIFTKAVVNSNVLGRVVAFIDMDFRGGEELAICLVFARPMSRCWASRPDVMYRPSVT